MGFLHLPRTSTLTQARRLPVYSEAEPPTLLETASVWLRADAITGLSDGAALVTWPDSSVNANDAQRGGGGLEPAYRTNIVNGLPAVGFESSNTEFMILPNTADFHLSAGTFTSLNVISVLGTSNHTLLRTRVLGAFGSASGWAVEFTNNGDFDHLVFPIEDTAHKARGLTCTLNLFNAGFTCLTVTFDATNFVVRKNGTVQSSSTVNENGTPPLGLVQGSVPTLGRSPGTNQRFFAGYMAEVIFYPSLLSGAQIDEIETYLMAKYAL